MHLDTELRAAPASPARGHAAGRRPGGADSMKPMTSAVSLCADFGPRFCGSRPARPSRSKAASACRRSAARGRTAGRLGLGDTVLPRVSKHLVLDLHQVVGVEEVARLEPRRPTRCGCGLRIACLAQSVELVGRPGHGRSGAGCVNNNMPHSIGCQADVALPFCIDSRYEAYMSGMRLSTHEAVAASNCLHMRRNLLYIRGGGSCADSCPRRSAPRASAGRPRGQMRGPQRPRSERPADLCWSTSPDRAQPPLGVEEHHPVLAPVLLARGQHQALTVPGMERVRDFNLYGCAAR